MSQLSLIREEWRTTKPAPDAVIRFDSIEKACYEASSRKALFSDGEFKDLLFERLDALMPGEGILSLDIFDTLLMRDNSSELTRFYEIGGMMANLVNEMVGEERISQIDAFLARHLGMRASYRATTAVQGCREGSLTEIHRTASRLLGQGDRFVEAFVATELKYETSRLEIHPLLAEYACKHAERGGRVVLLTDMYMHAEQVAELLSMMGIKTGFYHELVSSADTKVSKASGGIFPIMEKKMRATPGQFLHVGDSIRGDFRKPIEHGWHAMLLPVPKAEVLLRQQDHQKTERMLNEYFSLHVGIAPPQ